MILARWWKVALLGIAGILVVLWSVSQGSLSVNPWRIPVILYHRAPPIDYQILWNVRLPRVLCGAAVGASLAVAGTILQGVLRNPLAAPNIIGVTSGAGLAGYVILILFPGYSLYLPMGAFIGALITSLLVYALSWKNGIHPYRLIMAGVAVSSFLGAGMSTLMLYFPDRIHGVLVFMVGGLNGSSWPAWSMAWPYALAGLLLAILLSPALNVLGLGDDVAHSLGIRVEWMRFLLLATAALLSATAVSVAGLLGFVGLIVPHMVRLWIGHDHRLLIPASAIGGVILVNGADTIGRLLLDPMEIPVGIPMALLGGPFFLFLLRRNRS